jgi:hypothetical protein
VATYTNIPAFTSGQVLTSAVMNDVKNNLDLGNAQSAYPYRNLLYNGAVQVHQRGTSTASITAAGYYTADRWQAGVTTMGTWTQSVENDAPTGSGLRKSLKMLCTTADASPAAADRVFINQALEGFDVQRLAKGTASAVSLTLSFWVKSNVTGTFVASLYDNDNNRHCSRSYTISASATWERKEITFPADTSGVLDNDNAASLVATFYLGNGSNFTSGTLATSWASYVAANDAVGQTNVAAATNNYWQVTGVQLEVGSVSTPFEFLPFETDLAKCQRYWQQSYLSGVVAGTSTSDGLYDGAAGTNQPYGSGPYISYNVTMRATPIVTLYTEGGTSGQARWDRIGAGAETVSSYVAAGSPRGFSVQTSSLVQNRMNVRGHYIANAEL